MSDTSEAISLLNRAIQLKIEEHQVPGMAVAITDRHRLVWDSYYGSADLASGAAITPGTLFEIGSIGKSFTCIPLLQLYQEGQLDLHAPIDQYLPWLELQTEYDPVTVHHVMTHTAGFGIGADFAPSSCYEAWALQETPLPYPPGRHYRYSNVGYKLLGCLVEHLIGRPYAEILQERILDPAGMASSDAVTTHDSRKRMAVGYETFYDDRPWHSSHPLVPATWFEYGAGDGSPSCTAIDLAAYLRMLLNRGQAPGERILTEDSFDLMLQRAAQRPVGYYGYGLSIRDVEGHAFVGHDGGTIGYLATMLGDMDEGIGIVIMTNGPYHADKGALAEYALRLFRAVRQSTTVPEPPPVAADPTMVENADEYKGAYSHEGDVINLVAEGGQLCLVADELVPLERRGADAFYVNHPAFYMNLLAFGREEEQVVDAWYGPRRYLRAGVKPDKRSIDAPREWEAYPGHYRSYNPWLAGFRIILRGDSLIMSFQIKVTTIERRLVPRGNGLFVIQGDQDPSPDWLQFDTVVDGRALRATVWGGDYYRTFTPPASLGAT